MKRISYLFASLVVLSVSVARADAIRLNDIDTNDCTWAQSEISILNTPQIPVIAQCSPPGVYTDSRGVRYEYRLYTTAYLPSIVPGASFRLNDIDTNNCTRAQNEVRILNSQNVRVDAVCSPPGTYIDSRGIAYSYRLYTTVTVLR